jgi:hypothetical protein
MKPNDTCIRSWCTGRYQVITTTDVHCEECDEYEIDKLQCNICQDEQYFDKIPLTYDEATEIVGFKWQDKLYCRRCFYSVASQGKTISFGTMARAVALLANFHHCEKCNCNLREVKSAIKAIL